MSDDSKPSIPEMIATVNERIEKSKQTLEEAGDLKRGRQVRREKSLFPW